MPIPGPQHADARLGGMAAAWEKKLGSRGYWDRWPGWGMHAFGLWYARARWPAQLDATLLAADILQIARHRQTNGEVLQHGQCVPALSAVAWLLGARLVALVNPSLLCRRLCHWARSHCLEGSSEPPQKSLIPPPPLTIQVLHAFVWSTLTLLRDSQRSPPAGWREPSVWVAGACEVTRRFYGGGDGGDNAGVNIGACAHGAGRGLYHYYGDVGMALLACTRGNVLQEWGAGWRDNCGSGVYHSAFDGLSASRLGEMARDGDADVTAQLCEAN